MISVADKTEYSEYDDTGKKPGLEAEWSSR